MIARKCDRCGKFYEPYKEKNECSSKDVNGIAFVHIKTDNTYSGVIKDGLDLCHECLMAVIAFVKGGSKNDNKRDY